MPKPLVGEECVCCCCRGESHKCGGSRWLPAVLPAAASRTGRHLAGHRGRKGLCLCGSCGRVAPALPSGTVPRLLVSDLIVATKSLGHLPVLVIGVGTSLRGHCSETSETTALVRSPRSTASPGTQRETSLRASCPPLWGSVCVSAIQRGPRVWGLRRPRSRNPDPDRACPAPRGGI